MLVVVISAAQPVSLLAFDFARDFNPSASLGTAQGTVNMGGFLASLLVMQLMGLIIGAGDAWSFEAFRAAWLTQYLIWAIAAAAVVINARNVGRGGPARSVSDPAARVTPQKRPRNTRYRGYRGGYVSARGRRRRSPRPADQGATDPLPLRHAGARARRGTGTPLRAG